MTIHKKIVTDEQMRPVAVQIDYADWLEIARRLDAGASEASSVAMEPEPSDLRALARAARPYWEGGDGLEFQRRIRAEWTDPWEAASRQKSNRREGTE